MKSKLTDAATKNNQKLICYHPIADIFGGEHLTEHLVKIGENLMKILTNLTKIVPFCDKLDESFARSSFITSSHKVWAGFRALFAI